MKPPESIDISWGDDEYRYVLEDVADERVALVEERIRSYEEHFHDPQILWSLEGLAAYMLDHDHESGHAALKHAIHEIKHVAAVAAGHKCALCEWAQKKKEESQ